MTVAAVPGRGTGRPGPVRRSKAYTSASARNATVSMAQAAADNPAARDLVQIDGFLLLGGVAVLAAVGDHEVGLGAGEVAQRLGQHRKGRNGARSPAQESGSAAELVASPEAHSFPRRRPGRRWSLCAGSTMRADAGDPGHGACHARQVVRAAAPDVSRSSKVSATTSVALRRSARGRRSSARCALASSMVCGPAP